MPQLPNNIATKKILLVDDVASMRNMSKAILWDAGFKNIKGTDNGSNALKLIKKSHVDLVICDWEMPVMSGLELLKAVRNDESLNSLLFLMLTSSSDIEHVKKAIAAGVTGYITKPFQAGDFCKKIISCLT